MKILHVITSLENGGAQAVLFRLIRGDDLNTHCVVSLMDRGVYGRRFEECGTCVDTLNFERGRVKFEGLLRLRRLVREANPDVVQTWMYHADLVGGLVSRLSVQAPVVWGIRHSSLSSGQTSLSTRTVAHACALFSRWLPRFVISCSQRGANSHVKIGYSARKMRILPNGYDLDVFVPSRSASLRLRREWGIPDDVMLFGMVARWNIEKDHANLFDALAQAKGQVNNRIRLVLVGNGMDADNNALTEMLIAYGVYDDVLLCGERDDIAHVMNAIDCHVLSSRGEAFPNVVAEAMACATPAIVTDVGDAAVIVGESGWVVPPASSRRLAKAIVEVVNAKLMDRNWESRKAACRTRVMQHFDLRKMIAAYNEVWKKSLGNK